MIASKALEAGMIDEIGNFESLLNKKEEIILMQEKTEQVELDNTDAIAVALEAERTRSAECLAVVPASFPGTPQLFTYTYSSFGTGKY